MKKVFEEVNSLDKRCYENYYLSEDILMEHAALGLYKKVLQYIKPKNKVLIIAGSGNNGADGITMARLLFKELDVFLSTPLGVKSSMAKLQMKRFEALGGKTFEFENIKNIQFDIIVDCIFGSGLNKNISDEIINIIEFVNNKDGIKIACDIPSGIDIKGNPSPICFKADFTITMGAYKTSLLGDNVKDFVGDIEVCDLGINKELYQDESKVYILEKEDLNLPNRTKKSSHKGDFGHVCVMCGEKEGAAKLSANAAFSFGAGLVTMLVHEKIQIDDYIMQSHKIPSNTTSLAIGMGLGKYQEFQIKEVLEFNAPKIIDADLFQDNIILEFLSQNVVITPHPKEFCSLLKICNIADISVKELQCNRLEYAKEFCKKYPNVVLLLKGANTIIAQNDEFYFNVFGSQSLSKGGSGDVLSGMIASLLAQKYSLLDSAINASLAHALASQNYSKNNYSLNPIELIEEVKKL